MQQEEARISMLSEAISIQKEIKEESKPIAVAVVEPVLAPVVHDVEINDVESESEPEEESIKVD